MALALVEVCFGQRRGQEGVSPVHRFLNNEEMTYMQLGEQCQTNFMHFKT